MKMLQTRLCEQHFVYLSLDFSYVYVDSSSSDTWCVAINNGYWRH